MSRTTWFASALLLSACTDDVENPDTTAGDQEVITTVVLTFTPGAGEPLVFTAADPENDGSPVIDPITLADGEDYALAVQFLNELESPAEDITIEVDAESDQHQVFFTGDAIGPVVTHTYADTDANGLPVGLSSDIATVAPGAGAFTVTLRHLPVQDGAAQKVADLATVAAEQGLSALPGDSDASVTFDLTVE